MPSFGQLFHQLVDGMTAKGSRSNVVRPLLYIIGAFCFAVVAGVYVGAPTWMLVGLLSLLVASFLFFICMYVYFARKRPDSLRSETFALQQQLIDRGLVGDSSIGQLVDLEGTTSDASIAADNVKKIESK